MSFWSYANLASLTRGCWLVEPQDIHATLNTGNTPAGIPVEGGLWHDTRDIKPGQAYLAIAGENFDGHNFVPQAFAADAGLAIVQHDSFTFDAANTDQPILKVDDTIQALQDLARAYRDVLATSGCKVISVSGSNGKTTTRHLIHHVLSRCGLAGTQSPKSFNNHLGVPLTLLAAQPIHDYVACEIGTNKPGEVDFLGQLVRPDIAAITSIGEEHLEFFHDLKGVVDEEFAIVKHIKEAGPAILAKLDLEPALQRDIDSIVGQQKQQGPAIDPQRELPNFFGSHNASNASLAIQVGLLLGLPEADLRAALLTAQPAPHRSQRLTLGQGVTLIDDCYNANSDSLRAALADLTTESTHSETSGGGGRCVAILGDMFELGEQTPAAHRAIPSLLPANKEPGQWLTIYIGQAMHQYAYAQAIEQGQADAAIAFAQWTDDLPSRIADLLNPGDTVLLKGSRGMRLERIIPAIQTRFGEPSPAQA